MPIDILKITKHFMKEPVKILVKNEELTLEDIK
jgi:translation initiation factor 4A